MPNTASNLMANASDICCLPSINSFKSASDMPSSRAKSFVAMSRSWSSHLSTCPGWVGMAGMICLALVAIVIRGIKCGFAEVSKNYQFWVVSR